jgi:hypothetical protein
MLLRQAQGRPLRDPQGWPSDSTRRVGVLAHHLSSISYRRWASTPTLLSGSGSLGYVRTKQNVPFNVPRGTFWDIMGHFGTLWDIQNNTFLLRTPRGASKTPFRGKNVPHRGGWCGTFGTLHVPRRGGYCLCCQNEVKATDFVLFCIILYCAARDGAGGGFPPPQGARSPLRVMHPKANSEPIGMGVPKIPGAAFYLLARHAHRHFVSRAKYSASN